jgi:hypothetical protein
MKSRPLFAYCVAIGVIGREEASPSRDTTKDS